MNARIAALHYLETFLGTPYHWGGDDPMGGLDCSGLMVLVLQGVGRFPIPGDSSAEGLRQKYPAVSVPIMGCLAFRENDKGKTVHVGMVWEVLGDGTVLVIEAGGGDASTTDLAEAVKQNAFVKLRPVWANPHYADPFAPAAPGDV